MDDGLVYLLSNPAMPGLVKIGMTERKGVKSRMRELFSTGVPVPFECNYAGKVSNPKKVESALHQAFGPDLIKPKREFIEIEPDKAIVLLKLICTEHLPQFIKVIDMRIVCQRMPNKLARKKKDLIL